jgi:hypothetical protein
MSMRIARFAELLDSHGADFGRWPATEASAARALLAESPEAQQRLQAAARLDSLLRASRSGPDAAALARMSAHVAREVARAPLPAPPGRLHWLRPLLPMGGGAVLALAVCGIWLTVAPPQSLTGATDFTAPRQIATIESTD